jgi:membrane-associated phospholipid phosphatase
MQSRLLAAGALAAVFAALALAVAHSDAVHRVDERAVRNAMPGLSPRERPQSALSSVVPFRDASPHGDAAIRLVTDLWTLPASPLVSALLFGGGCLLLLRGRRRSAAAAWAGAWVAGNAVEALTKHALERPALYALEHGIRIHVADFDHSYPSGHALRSVLLAGLVAALLPRLRAASALWAAAVLPLLLVAGFHTPSDLAGGALLAGLLLALVPLATRDTARS